MRTTIIDFHNILFKERGFVPSWAQKQFGTFVKRMLVWYKTEVVLSRPKRFPLWSFMDVFSACISPERDTTKPSPGSLLPLLAPILGQFCHLCSPQPAGLATNAVFFVWYLFFVEMIVKKLTKEYCVSNYTWQPAVQKGVCLGAFRPLDCIDLQFRGWQ